MVDLEGELVAVGSDRTLCSCDQPGVVNQHVDPRVLATQRRRELTHLAEVSKVGDMAFRADLRSDRARLARRPSDQNDPVASPCQRPGRGSAYPVAPARYHHNPAIAQRLVDAATVNCGPYSTVKGNCQVLIGEAARRAGVSRDTVRLYTRLGLVACTPRPAGSKAYADYDQDAVELIKNIKVAQSIGFSLSELVPIAAAYVAGRLDDGEQRLLLEAKLAEIEERQGKLRQMSEFLWSKLNDLPASD